MRTTKLTCEVLVAGGGPAGVPAALAAARCGARVILCQNRPVLGGNASSEVRMHVVGADAAGRRGEELAVEAREGGIIEEIRLETAARNPQRSSSMLDLTLYDLCRSEPNLELLLNTEVVAATVDGHRIVAATADRQSTEDRFVIAAQVFVDCTGDGRLGVEAGARFRHGREATDEYGESLAQPTADRQTLGSTLLFTARRHDRPMPFVAPSWARRFTEEELRLRPHASQGYGGNLEYGYWWVEWGGQLDTIADNERIRDELLAILLGVWDHIKNGGDHGAEHWALDWFGFLPGKRESRRFVGLVTLSQGDLESSRRFDDAIAFGGWPLDDHPPDGVDRPGEPPCVQIPLPHLYDVPLSACISADLDNLMFAGRNISASHVAFSSTRVMATCAVIGQGVGTAAAHAVASGVAPAELPNDRELVRQIQQRLLRDDCYLIGVERDDAADLVPLASVTASSSQPEGCAQAVLSAQSRSVHGSGGAPPGRTAPGAHRWMSDPGAGLPAWLELAWQEPVELAEIRLVFDTGLHRLLTLSLSDAFTEKMCWGRQPETARSYTIEAMVDGRWVEMHHVADNYQRLCVHHVQPVAPVSRLRVTVTATHGIDHARICEVRVHGEG